MQRRLLTQGSVVAAAAVLAIGAAWLLADGSNAGSSPLQGELPAPSWTYREVTEWPEAPQPEVLYVGVPAGERTPVAAMLLCPCGCGDAVRISLREHDDPHWVFAAEGDRPTLRPSIWRRSGCQSHFTLTAGIVTLLPGGPRPSG